jgi:hypothetical protein
MSTAGSCPPPGAAYDSRLEGGPVSHPSHPPAPMRNEDTTGFDVITEARRCDNGILHTLAACGGLKVSENK